MKKILVTSVMLVMLLCMVGCGAETTNEEVETIVESVEEPIVEESEVVEVESTVVEETTEVMEETTTELSEEEILNDMKASDMEKLTRAMSAWTYLVNSSDTVDRAIQEGTESLEWYTDIGAMLIAKDGTFVEEGPNYWDITIEYYNNIINKNMEPYSIKEYVSKLDTIEDIPTHTGKGEDTQNTTLFEFIGILPTIMSKTGSLTIENYTETAEYIMEDTGVTSARSYDLYLDGESLGITLSFDSNGNLLNAHVSEDFEYITSTEAIDMFNAAMAELESEKE